MDARPVLIAGGGIGGLAAALGLAQKGIRRTDENRAAIETLGHDAYDTLSYYERWTAALARILIDKGVLTQDEIDAKLAQLRARNA